MSIAKKVQAKKEDPKELVYGVRDLIKRFVRRDIEDNHKYWENSLIYSIKEAKHGNILSEKNTYSNGIDILKIKVCKDNNIPISHYFETYDNIIECLKENIDEMHVSQDTRKKIVDMITPKEVLAQLPENDIKYDRLVLKESIEEYLIKKLRIKALGIGKMTLDQLKNITIEKNINMHELHIIYNTITDKHIENNKSLRRFSKAENLKKLKVKIDI
jgi:hypothetical protein